MDECKICGKPAKETHHIKEQQSADDNNMIDHFHKNNKHNLVQLCKKCHDSITYGKLNITGYVQTSSGVQLQYEILNTKKSKKKYDDNKVNIIKTYKNHYDLNIGDCIKKLKMDHDITISRPILKKIMNNEY